MPTHKYVRPKNLVTEVYRGKEVETLMKSALQSTFRANGIRITPGKVQRFMSSIPQSPWGGKVVLIVEQYPLASMEARGKHKNLIYERIGKTGNQYSKTYKKPKNPRTPLQQANRGKLPTANQAWRALSPAQKTLWNKKAKGTSKTGNNLFVSKYLLTH